METCPAVDTGSFLCFLPIHWLIIDKKKKKKEKKPMSSRRQREENALFGEGFFSINELCLMSTHLRKDDKSAHIDPAGRARLPLDLYWYDRAFTVQKNVMLNKRRFFILKINSILLVIQITNYINKKINKNNNSNSIARFLLFSGYMWTYFTINLSTWFT